MSFPQRSDRYRLWVTDTGRNEMADYLEMGFTYCDKAELEKEGYIGEGRLSDGDVCDSRIAKNAGRAGHTDNAIAYLMEIDMSEWQEIRKEIIETKRKPMLEIIKQNEALKRKPDHYGEMNVKNF